MDNFGHGGKAPGFNFPASTMAGAGQISSNVDAATSLGHGNYNSVWDHEIRWLEWRYYAEQFHLEQSTRDGERHSGHERTRCRGPV